MEQVTCAEHGAQETTYVCCHLAACLDTGEAVGFYYAGEPRGDAWCSACEEVRIREGGESGDWNDASEAFADITMLCGACYDQIRKINGF